MDWLVLVIIGITLGAVARLLMVFNSGIRISFCLVLGVLGALIGGVLDHLNPTAVFGSRTFYLMGALIAIALLVGGIFARTLTAKERRI